MMRKYLLFLPILLIHQASLTNATNINKTISDNIDTILSSSTKENRQEAFKNLTNLNSNHENFQNLLQEALESKNNNANLNVLESKQWDITQWNFTKRCMQDEQWDLASIASTAVTSISSVVYEDDIMNPMYQVLATSDKNSTSYKTVSFFCSWRGIKQRLFNISLDKSNWVTASEVLVIEGYPISVSNKQIDKIYPMLAGDDWIQGKNISDLKEYCFTELDTKTLVDKVVQENNMDLGKTMLKRYNFNIKDFITYPELYESMMQEAYDSLSLFQKLYPFETYRDKSIKGMNGMISKESCFYPYWMQDDEDSKKELVRRVRLYKVKCGIGGAIGLLVLGGGGYYYYKTTNYYKTTKTAKKKRKKKAKKKHSKKTNKSLKKATKSST